MNVTRTLSLSCILLAAGCGLSPRADVAARSDPVLPPGDALAGRQVFVDLSCTSCHRVDGDPDLQHVVSAQPGPDLGTTQARRGARDLVAAIVTPSHEIDEATRAGLDGELSPMGDFSDVMSVRQLADLVAYIQSLGTPEPPAAPGPTDEGNVTMTTSTTDLLPAEKAALRDALDDEQRAWATYDQVIADFGPVRPFTNIRDAEARHIDLLTFLFDRYGLDVPDNPWPGKVERYASVAEACKAGIDAEVDNAQLYDRLLRSTSRPDILAVFRQLQAASTERHLPAFTRCLERGPRGGGRWPARWNRPAGGR